MPLSHPNSLDFEKQHARLTAKEVRANCFVEGASLKLLYSFPLTRFKGASIAGYWPIGTEMDIRELMRALSDKHILSLPCTPSKGEPLSFRHWSYGDTLKTGLFGTREPPKSREVVSPDLIFVPLLAFTKRGERLGYGGGYYDRTLTQLRAQKDIFACGVAFAAQETETLPMDENDAVLDGVLTEDYFKAF